MKKKVFGFLWWIVSLAVISGQGPDINVSATVVSQWESDGLRLEVSFGLPSGYHIGANDLLKIDLNLPESLWVLSHQNLPEKIGPAEFPYYQYNPVFVYYYKPLSALPETIVYQADLVYQVCSEGKNALCFPPAEQTITFSISPSLSSDTSPESDISQSAGLFSQEGVSQRLGNLLSVASWWIYLLVFLGGILTSFTPCVYPMIPIIIGYIGSRTESKKQALILSLFFTLGLSLTYAIMGILASTTGSVFGSLTQNRGVIILIAAIFILMGLSMFGLFELQIPSGWMARIQSRKRQGWTGAVFMGVITGFIGAPCVGPVLISLLTFVTTTGSVIKGFFLLFFYGLGMSLLFIIIGTFTGVLKSLPASGGWMNAIKYFFGTLMFGIALYFLQGFIPQNHWLTLVGILLTFIGMVFWKNSGEMDSTGAIARRTLVLLILAAGILFWVVGIIGILKLMPPSNPPVAVSLEKISTAAWINNDWDFAWQRAQSEQKPIFIDVYAKWCVACNELEEKTWPDPEIQKEFQRYILLKLDFTVNSDWQKQMVKRFNIRGMPTLILLNAQGQEIYRHPGFIYPQDLLLHLKKI